MLSTLVAKVFPTLRTSIAKAIAESRTLLSGKINMKFATVLHLDYILGRWRRQNAKWSHHFALIRDHSFTVVLWSI